MPQTPLHVREIFCAAQDFANPQLRAAYLDQACQDNPDLRGRVEELLRAQAEAEGFLPEPPGGRALHAQHPDTPLLTMQEGLVHVPSIPGYEIGALLGRGGMGLVYQARQLQLNRPVALKMILAGRMASADDVARFLSEAEAVAALHHPNIVQVFEVGRHESLPFMALELVAGNSLANKLQAGPLAPRPAARLLEQVARGMNAAHQAGIVHRDLKPANVLLTPDGTPKITDFGLAKRVEGLHADAAADTLTQTGAILGTPSYMAPEQAQGHNKRVGPAADIFALGAILYECLTGQPPFKAESMLETLRCVVEQDPLPPRQLRPRLPRDLQTICLKC